MQTTAPAGVRKSNRRRFIYALLAALALAYALFIVIYVQPGERLLLAIGFPVGWILVLTFLGVVPIWIVALSHSALLFGAAWLAEFGLAAFVYLLVRRRWSQTAAAVFATFTFFLTNWALNFFIAGPAGFLGMGDWP